MTVPCWSCVFNRHDDCEIMLGGQDDRTDATCCCERRACRGRGGAAVSHDNPTATRAAHRFNNALRYRSDDHELQRQLTPPYVLEPVRQWLDGIGLDPCTEPDNPCGAEAFFTPPADGATEAWTASSIYVNPPYSKARERWVARCVDAGVAGARVVLLMPSHTDTRLFHRAVATATHVVFIRGRVKFGVLRSNRRQEAASHPSCLIGWNMPSPQPVAHLGVVWELREAVGDRA